MNTITQQQLISFTRLASKLVSYLFHPLFIPAYVAYIILYIHPVNAVLLTPYRKLQFISNVVFCSALLPAFITFLLWKLGFAKNIFLHTSKERIIPYNVAIIFNFWMFWVSKNLEDTPPQLKHWTLGIFLTSSVGMMLNNFFKISMHGLAVGGLLCFAIYNAFINSNLPNWFLFAAILLTGIVASSRLVLKAHKPMDVYIGILAGVVCQIAAGWWVY